MEQTNGRTLKVRIDNWSNPRFLRVEPRLGIVALEVFWLRCACDTCFRRLDTVIDRAKKAGVGFAVTEISVPERGQGAEPSVVLAVPVQEIPENAPAFFQKILGLEIKEVA